MGTEGVEVALLYCVLACVVDDKGTLLCLLTGVAAYIHKRINHPIKSVDLVVPYYDPVIVFGKNVK